VVPLKNALLLAKAAHLTATHHIQLEATHYSGIIYLPFLISHIAEKALH